MAEDNDKNSPSADEIVDEMAADMGVEDEEVPEEEDSSVGDLGGIFDVPSSRKRKKKKKSKKEKLKAALEKEKEREAAEAGDESSEADETVEKEVSADGEVKQEKAAEKKKKKKSSSSSDDGTVGGVFNPKAKEDDVDLMSGGVDDAYLDDDDLGDYGGGGMSTSSMVMGGVIVLLLAVIGVLVFQFTDVGKRMYWLMTGQLEKRELKEAEAEAERKRQEHLESLTKYGALNIMGSPQYALLKLDGEIQYGQTSTGEWKELRLTPSTVFQGLKVGEKHEIVVEAPGHKRKSYDLTEGMWDGNPEQPSSYRKTLNVTLIPESGEKQIEYQQRLESDVENDYYGTLEINSIPSGAYVILDNRLMRNEDGTPMTTPISTDKYWAAEELVGSDEEKEEAKEQKAQKGQKAGQQSGQQPMREDLVPKMLAREKSDMTLEEKEIRVDTPLDRGHKLQVRVPDEKGEYPHYITNIERQMWTCSWKDGEVPEEQPYTKACDYKYTLELDFNGLKSYIERREEEKKKIMERNQKLKAAAGDDGKGEKGEKGESKAQ